MPNTEQQEQSINTIRFLSADAVQKANSGHPGLPMGVAAIGYTLWTRHLVFDPADPHWPNRDRFVLSAGHGSMLLYSLLHLAGYALPMEEIQRFRQWGSITPGHPEYGETPGVETTTGPLGQGFGNAVGMGIATEVTAARYNREGFPLIDHFIYAVVSDGDLMEGVASEAASLAGHLKLGRLIFLYDDNRISIDGSTDLSFTEDRSARFEAYGWQVLRVEDGNAVEEIDQAIRIAKQDPRPSLIVCRTHIGYGLPTRQDTAKAHGEPPGEEELRGAKEALGWPVEAEFLVPEDVRFEFQDCAEKGRQTHNRWKSILEEYRKAFPEIAAEWDRTRTLVMPEEFVESFPRFEADEKGMATRASSGKVLNAIAPVFPELLGGSADLTGSNKTDIQGLPPFSSENRSGRYLHYGVREHAMGSLMNGMALYGGVLPYGGTFLVFSDYLRPTIRLAAMMGLQVVYVFTHDSVGLGEDGPTHQPIEHLAALRTIPNLMVLRPADANEVSQAWKVALQRRSGPTALALSRQSVPTLDRKEFNSEIGLERGAYVLKDFGQGAPRVLLLASGSEVQLILEAARILERQHNLAVRVISFPSWELYESQPQAYREEVIPQAVKARVAVEAGVSLGWDRWVGEQGMTITLDRYGASAPYQELYSHLGLTSARVVQAALTILSTSE